MADDQRWIGRPARLLAVPLPLLGVAGRAGDLVRHATGLSLPVSRANVRRSAASLVLDSQKLRTRLGWHPPVLLMEGLTRAAQWYLRRSGA